MTAIGWSFAVLVNMDSVSCVSASGSAPSSLVSGAYAVTLQQQSAPELQSIHHDLAHVLGKFEMTCGKYDVATSASKRWFELLGC